VHGHGHGHRRRHRAEPEIEVVDEEVVDLGEEAGDPRVHVAVHDSEQFWAGEY
jgi:hypothetical protein